MAGGSPCPVTQGLLSPPEPSLRSRSLEPPEEGQAPGGAGALPTQHRGAGLPLPQDGGLTGALPLQG